MNLFTTFVFNVVVTGVIVIMFGGLSISIRIVMGVIQYRSSIRIVLIKLFFKFVYIELCTTIFVE